MKRVIEIDEALYERIANTDMNNACGIIRARDATLINALAGSTPLNEVLDKITDEVKKVDAPRCRTYDAYFKGRKEAVERVLEIIAKHKESEDRE